MGLTGLAYDDWLEHAFGREVRIGRGPWFFDPDQDWWSPGDAEYVEHLTRLFLEPEALIERYTDSQIEQA
jgi:hypothetical protein